MKQKTRIIDKVRASRDGHEFHEAWAARKALELVMPRDDLVGIAVEGLAPSDQVTASAATVEIADLVLYYGKRPTFTGARSIVIAQFKYSIGSENVPFRASDAKETIRKFALAFRNYKKNHNATAVEKKLTFALVTNRPIYKQYEEAITGLASGLLLTGIAKKQADQFKSASGLRGKLLLEFAQKITISGLAGSVSNNKQRLARILADWSVAPDAMARARLGGIRQLLREKAGSAGDGRNVIQRADVLDVLEIQSPDDLFPCPTSFPEVGKVVRREQLASLALHIPSLSQPLLIHAAGGTGKTVFLQSLSKTLSVEHEIVLFDCFGGGAYRAPDDARHLAKRGLIHIINNLSCKGLCDPLLPVSEHLEELIKAFRSRLSQAVNTLKRESPTKQILLFIDAIDNAAEQAKDKNESSFPTLILESIHHNGPIDGVQIIVSCRTHRREISRGHVPCEEFKLEPFSMAESKKYLRDRIPSVTDIQVEVAHSRSGGNPRVLEHLALSDRGLLDTSEIKNVIELDELIRARIQKALTETLKRGYKNKDIDTFLAGLSVLPPPVPLDEYADAHGMEFSAVESFAADLAPLLEQTKHGLMFRDEPTETFIRESYAANEKTLKNLSKNLFDKQGVSVYAASALPGLLQKIDDGDLLFKLAFDERFPAEIKSTVGKQNIRYARLKSAVLHSAQKENFDRLVQLIVELSTLAAVNQRGTEYVLDSPDLVIASQDFDATRRLFECRTSWPGARHARIAIANALAGDMSNAYRHSISAREWIQHYFQQSEDYRREHGGPEKIDLAAICLCYVAEGNIKNAVQFISIWRDWYAYEVSEHLFRLLEQAKKNGSVPSSNIDRLLIALKPKLSGLAAALSFLESDDLVRRDLIGSLAKACKRGGVVKTGDSFHRDKGCVLRKGLAKAAVIGISLSMHAEAMNIASSIPNEIPGLWSFTDHFPNEGAFPFILYSAILSTINGYSIHEKNILPKELIEFGNDIPDTLSGEKFRKSIREKLDEKFKSENKTPDEKRTLSYERKGDSEKFINDRLESLLDLTKALISVLSSESGKADKSFQALVDLWGKLRSKKLSYSSHNETNMFFDFLGRHLLIFLLWSRSDISIAPIESFLDKITQAGVGTASTLIEIVVILAKRDNLHNLAGEIATKANALIDHEDDVNSRAALRAELSRAILPASSEESATYFHLGLEQMDAIGSGDYQFTNELLLFASELRGEELADMDVHTLTNICELNMPSEEHKFPWYAFARGLSRVSGGRALSKLARWEDRSKISLDYTLLPYLTALIDDEKIDPAIAIALLSISEPVELHSCGTKQLAEVLEKKQYKNAKELLTELINQFERNHTGPFMSGTTEALGGMAIRVIGEHSEQAKYLTAAAPRFKKINNEGNDNRNYRGSHDKLHLKAMAIEDRKNRLSLIKMSNRTDPNDEASMVEAVEFMNKIQRIHDLKKEFFDSLRKKVKFSERSNYIKIVVRLEAISVYTKLHELKECKREWAGSSASLATTFREIGVPLIQLHAEDFVSNDYLSGSNLKEISELSGIGVAVLAIELIKIFSAPDYHLPASIWMALASTICERTNEGAGQVALTRLLNSNAAQLASTVADGVWAVGHYPNGDAVDIAAGLIWFSLGSPLAMRRWRAAHSIRSLARLGRWNVIDAIIAKFPLENASPYQAPELPFHFFSARLWLMIAIARIAIDDPMSVGKYKKILTEISLDNNVPHALIRHFAVEALSHCESMNAITLTESESIAIGKVNISPFPRIKRTGQYFDGAFYQERPDAMVEPEFEFSLDYDFEKYDVKYFSRIFDKPRWEIIDAITAWTQRYDQKVTSMHDTGSRYTSQRALSRGINDWNHLYGQQLVWHSLHLIAGQFLATTPVIESPYSGDDLWDDWIKNRILTRGDGLWISDGVDRAPLECQINLLEQGEKGLVLTGDRKKILSLISIDTIIKDSVVACADWLSADNITVHISSALVPPKKARSVARQLVKDDPFLAWLPQAEEDDDESEYFRTEKKDQTPWVVRFSREQKLDATDPLGAPSVTRRPRLTKAISSIHSLSSSDPFKRAWVDKKGNVMVRSEAWGRNRSNDDESPDSGLRLTCNSTFLRDVLSRQKKDLIILIILRRYEKGHSSQGSKYWHTTAVIRIKDTLDFEYFPGFVNALHVTKY